MNKIVKLNEVAEIKSGQILKRVVVDKNAGDECRFVKKVITQKSILDDGTISLEYLTEEHFKTMVNEIRITKVGDIVIKLATPFDSAVITEVTAGCVIPSFCAVIRNTPVIDKMYLLAFLKSSLFKEQLQKQAAGAFSTLMPIGIIGETSLPLPSAEEQKEIGEMYKKAQSQLVLMKKIVALENKKLNVIFKELNNEI